MNGWMQLQRIKRVEAKVGTTFVWIRAANTLIGLSTTRRSRCGSCPGSTIGTGLLVTYTGAGISGRIGRSKTCNLIGAEGSYFPPVITLSCTPDPEHDGVFVSVRLEVMREGIEDYELLMESARRVPERTDALARAVMPTFTEYIRDVNQFREFERELLVLVTEAQRE